MLPARGSSPLSRIQWLILGLLFFSTVVNYIDRQALSVLKKTLCEALEISNAEYGYVTGTFMFVYAVAGLGLGVWIDRVGVRFGLGLAALVWSLAAMTHGFVAGFWSLLALRALLAFGEGANWPAGGKAVARWLPPDRRAFGMAIFDGGSAVGAVIAPPLVMALKEGFGWRVSFVVTGLIGLVWVALWWLFYDDPARHRGMSEEDRAKLAGPSAQETVSRLGFWPATRELVQTRALWGLMTMRFIATPVWWFYVFWLPGYLQDVREFSAADIAMFAWMPYLMADVGKIFGGLASDALLARGTAPGLARKGVMFVGGLFMTVGLLMPLVDALAAGIASFCGSTLDWEVAPASVAKIAAIVVPCCATLGFGIWSSNTLALHTDCFRARVLGTAIGVTGLAAAMGGSLFTTLVGHLGYDYAFFAAGLMPGIAFVVLVFGVGRVKAVNEQ